MFLFRIGSGTGLVHIDMIRESSFSELETNKGIQWQHYTVDPGFKHAINGPFTTKVIHTDKTTRLDIFCASESAMGVEYPSIPLRKDGSINSTSSSIKSTDKQYLKAPVYGKGNKLKVLENEGRFIMLWENCAQRTHREMFYAYTGSVQPDGQAPNAGGWEKVPVTFENEHIGKANESFAYSALVVPGDYE